MSFWSEHRSAIMLTVSTTIAAATLGLIVKGGTATLDEKYLQNEELEPRVMEIAARQNWVTVQMLAAQGIKSEMRGLKRKIRAYRRREELARDGQATPLTALERVDLNELEDELQELEEEYRDAMRRLGGDE